MISFDVGTLLPAFESTALTVESSTRTSQSYQGLGLARAYHELRHNRESFVHYGADLTAFLVQEEPGTKA